MLAGLLVAPSRYAPTNNLEKSQNRANVILGLMEQQGFLSAKSAQYFRENPAKLSTKASQKAGGHFADWVMQSAPHFLQVRLLKMSRLTQLSIQKFNRLPKTF